MGLKAQTYKNVAQTNDIILVSKFRDGEQGYGAEKLAST